MSQVSVLGTTIPANETKSGEINLGDHQLVAIEIPTTFNGTTLTFESKSQPGRDTGALNNEADDNAETWRAVIDSAGAAITWTVAANRIVVPTAAHAAAMAPLKFLRIVAGTAQNPTRVLKLIVKEA